METTLRLVDISRLNRHEFAVLIGYTLTYCQRHLDECRNVPDIDFSAIGPVENYLRQLEPMMDDYRTAQRRSRGSHWTAQLAEADQQRDRAMAALRAAVRLHLLSDRAEEQQAAALLHHLLRQQRKFEQKNYAAKSAQISILVSQLESETVRPAVDLLQLERYIERLERVAAAFKEVSHSADLDRSARPTATTVSLRGPMTDLYRNLCQYVQALAVATQSPVAEGLLTHINLVRADCAEKLARRLTVLAKRKAKKEQQIVDAKAEREGKD